MDDEFFATLRGIERERMHDIWKLAKADDIDDLPEEEQLLAHIMLNHEDEYGFHFEFTDAVLDYDYRAEGETNPFVHITFHAIVENQLAAREPKEAYQFYNAMRKKKLAHHETIHLIGRILAPFIFHVLKAKQEFDAQGYAAQLRHYKHKRPARIWALLDGDG